MNLISNCCLGAWTYEQAQIEYNNPFMWAKTNADSFLYLMKNYDKIDLENIFTLQKHKRPDGCLYYSIIVNDNLEIEFTHYLEAYKKENEKKLGGDRFIYEAYKYTVEKYQDRVNRLKETNELPTFVILDEKRFDFDYTFENCRKICESDIKYKVLLITEYEELKKYEKPNFKIIIDTTKRTLNECRTQDFANKYHKEIIEFTKI